MMVFVVIVMGIVVVAGDEIPRRETESVQQVGTIISESGAGGSATLGSFETKIWVKPTECGILAANAAHEGKDNCPDSDCSDTDWYVYIGVTSMGTRYPADGCYDGDDISEETIPHDDWDARTFCLNKKIGPWYITAYDKYEFDIYLALLENDGGGSEDYVMDISSGTGEGGICGNKGGVNDDYYLPQSLLWSNITFPNRGRIVRYQYSIVEDTIISPKGGEGGIDGYQKWAEVDCDDCCSCTSNSYFTSGAEDGIYLDTHSDYEGNGYLYFEIEDDYNRQDLSANLTSIPFDTIYCQGAQAPALTSQTKSITFSNIAGASESAHITMSIVGKDSSEFTIDGATDRDISAGSSAVVDIKFEPWTPDTEKTATLQVVADYPCTPSSFDIPLTGVASHLRSVEFNTASIDFGTVEIHTSSTAGFWLSSTGSNTPIATVQVFDSGNFEIITSAYPGSIGAGDNYFAATVFRPGGPPEHNYSRQAKFGTIEFHPHAPGHYEGILKANGGGEFSPQNITLTGDVGELTITPDPCPFGKVNNGSFTDHTLTLTNTGTGTITGMLNITGSNESRFTFVGGSPSFSLSEGKSTTITIRFSPNAGRNFSAILHAEGDNVRDVDVPLTGIGTNPPTACISVSGRPVTATKQWGPNTEVPLSGSCSHDNDEAGCRIIRYDWNFGDATGWHYDCGSDHGLAYTLPAGVPFEHHVVSLTVYDNEDVTDTCTIAVNITEGDIPPTAVASITTPPYGRMVGLPISFDGSGSCDPDSHGPGIVTCEWQFPPDDGPATWHLGSTVDHSYLTSGEYKVRLRVTDDEGGQDVHTIELSVADFEDPTADPGGPYRAMTDETITFNGSGSHDNDPGGIDSEIVSYQWQFISGDTWHVTKDACIGYAYATEGNYTAVLNVTDNDGATDETSVTVTIQGYHPPRAIIYPSMSRVGLDKPVVFDGTQSHDRDENWLSYWPPGLDITKYDWDFGDGSPGDGSGWYCDRGPTPTYTYDSSKVRPGTYTVQLRVWDDEGTSSIDSAILIITPYADPTADPGGPYEYLEYCPATFDASASADNDEDGLSIRDWCWNYGDGSPWDNYTYSIGEGRVVVHTYDENGIYPVTLDVTDNEVASDRTKTLVTIINNPPIPRPTVRRTDLTTFQFDASESVYPRQGHDATSADLTYRWDCTGNGAWNKMGDYTTVETIGWDYGDTTGPIRVALEIDSVKDGPATQAFWVCPYKAGDIQSGCSNPEAFFFSYPQEDYPYVTFDKTYNRYWVSAPAGWFAGGVAFLVNGKPAPTRSGIDYHAAGGRENWSVEVAMSDLSPGDQVVIHGLPIYEQWRQNPCPSLATYDHRYPLWTKTYTPQVLPTPAWFVNFLANESTTEVVHADDYSWWELHIDPTDPGTEWQVLGCNLDIIGGPYTFNIYAEEEKEILLGSNDSTDLSGIGYINKEFFSRTGKLPAEGPGPVMGIVDLGKAYREYKKGGHTYGVKTDVDWEIEFKYATNLHVAPTGPSLDGTMRINGAITASFKVPVLELAFKIPDFLLDIGVKGSITLHVGVETKVKRLSDNGVNFMPGDYWELGPFGLDPTLAAYAEVLGGLAGVEFGIYGDTDLTVYLPSEAVKLTVEGGFYGKESYCWGLKCHEWKKPWGSRTWWWPEKKAGSAATVAASGTILALNESSTFQTITQRTTDVLCLQPEQETVPSHHSPWMLAANVVPTATPKVAVLDSGKAVAVWTDLYREDDAVYGTTWLQTDIWWSQFDGATWSIPDRTRTRGVCEYLPELTVVGEGDEARVVLTYLQVNRTVRGDTDFSTFYHCPLVQTAVWDPATGWNFGGANLTILGGTVNALQMDSVGTEVFLTYLVDAAADPYEWGTCSLFLVNGNCTDGRIIWQTPVCLTTLEGGLLPGDCAPSVCFNSETTGGVYYTVWNTSTNQHELVFVGTNSGLTGPFRTTSILQTNSSLHHLFAHAVDDDLVITWVEMDNESRICQCPITYTPATDSWDLGTIEEVYANTSIVFAKPLANATDIPYIIFQMGLENMPYVIEQLPNGSWGHLRSVAYDDSFSQGQMDGDAAGTYSQMVYVNKTSLSNWLVGHWRCNEGSGTTTADCSGRNNTGVLQGATTWGNHTNATLGEEYVSYLTFDGSSDYVEMICSSDIFDFRDEFTVCFWINRSHDTSTSATVVGQEGSWLVEEDHGNLTLTLERTDATYTIDIPDVPLHTWTFVSIIYNHGLINVTVRPTGGATVFFEQDLGNHSLWLSWWWFDFVMGGFHGSIDEVWLFSRDISMSQVNSIWFAPYCQLQSIHHVKAQALPVFADFSYTIVGGGDKVTTETEVKFTGSPTPLEFYWSLGDGSGGWSWDDTWIHRYFEPGWYTVTCDAVDPITGIATPLSQRIYVWDDTPPEFVGLRDISLTGEQDVTLDWDEAWDWSPSLLTYHIFVRMDDDSFNYSSPAITVTNATTFTFTGLTPGIIYSFVVRAVDIDGNSDDNTHELSVTITDSTPPVFAGLDLAIAINNRLGEVMLQWDMGQDPSEPLMYHVYMADPAGAYDWGHPIASTDRTDCHLYGLDYRSYSFVVRAADTFGNEDTNVEERTVTPTGDIAPPATTKHVGSPKFGLDDYWITSTTALSLVASDEVTGVAATWYRLWRTGAWTAWTRYTDPILLADEGLYYLEFHSVDNAGNVEAIQNDSHVVDDMAPVAQLTVHGNIGSYISPTSTFELTAQDCGNYRVGHCLVHFKIDGIYAGVSSSPKQFQINRLHGYKSGKHTVEYWSEDALGNKESSPHKESFYLDTSGPTLEVSFDGISEVTQTRLWYIVPDTLIVLDANDRCGVDSIYYRLNDGNWTMYKQPFSLNERGQYDVYFYAIDKLGNIGSLYRESIQVGGGEPVTSCHILPVEPTGDNGWYVNPVIVELTAIDEESGVNYTKYKVNGGGWSIYADCFILESNRVHRIEYYSVDNAGNEEDLKETTVKMDFTAPDVAIEKPAGYLYLFDRALLPLSGNKPVVFGKITIEATVNDATSTVDKAELYIDGELAETFGNTIKYTLDKMMIGNYVIKIRAYDKAGNVMAKTQDIWILNI